MRVTEVGDVVQQDTGAVAELPWRRWVVLYAGFTAAAVLAMLFKPTPTDRAGYFESYVQTWKVLRAGSFPLDEARDLARARQNFARGLNPAGVVRQRPRKSQDMTSPPVATCRPAT